MGKSRVNEDAKVVRTVREGLKQTGGYCHCMLYCKKIAKCWNLAGLRKNEETPEQGILSCSGVLLFPSLKLGNNIFDLSRFARRRSRRQPQNMADITSDL